MTQTYGWGSYWGTIPWGGRAAVVNPDDASASDRTVTTRTAARTVTVEQDGGDV